MSGPEQLKFLLDTNFILGLLKETPALLMREETLRLAAAECAYSSVTRMELLGFSGITAEVDKLLREKLAQLTYLPISLPVEDAAISLRRLRKVKLPDALIAATAHHHGLRLLTLDQHLQAVADGMAEFMGSGLET